MGNRLKGFKFKIQTAFSHVNNSGYEAILVNGLNAITINFLVDNTPCIINIDDENEFINDLLKIEVNDWNNKGYFCLTEDAWTWNIELSYDDKSIVSGGLGGFPKNFLLFMDLLHDKYGLKYSDLDRDIIKKGKVIKFKWWSKDTRIVPYHEIQDLL